MVNRKFWDSEFSRTSSSYTVMAEKLKEYMKELDDLPPLIQKNTEELRRLDEEVERIMSMAQARAVKLVNNLKRTPMKLQVEWYKEMQGMYAVVDKLNERKVKLADEMYNAVDMRIREMDKMMLEFQELRVRKHNETHATNAGQPTSNTQNRQRSKSTADPVRKANKLGVTRPKRGAFKPSTITAADMPVGDNEPNYRISHQVPSGQMVACDEPECKIEMSQFQCACVASSPVEKKSSGKRKGAARKKKIKS
ncbi:hypothetical protein RB195_021964 [Necator americanus]|uniref:Inhibitor of growth protein N-terminal histone-binding domain-containing protein n=1 Tax=Necator americanus TaxID=51031 RepID=A0ABR1EDM6_NECAM